MSDEPEERIQKIAEHHQVIAKILTCPICLELLLSPTRTKCGHVFCQGCLEDHIKKGKRGRTSCPMCNAEGITKRGLESDATVTGLVAVFKKLLQAEKNDMGNVIDFMNIRIQRKGARESVATPLKEKDNLPNKLPAIQNIPSDFHCSFSEDGDTPDSYGDILDTIGAGSNTDSADDKDKPTNISKHGIKKLKLPVTSGGSIKPSPLSATPTSVGSTKPSPSTAPSLDSGGVSPVRSVKPSATSRFWNKTKPKGPKTYSKTFTVSTTGLRDSANPDISRSSGNTDVTRVSANTDVSQMYPGEAVEGDKEWEDKRKTRNLPILAGVDREERVEEWLKTGVDGFASPGGGQFVDLSSQPSLSQGTESTPSLVKGVRPSPGVSPLDVVAMRGEKVKFFKSKVGSLRKSPDASGLISKTVLGKGTDDDLYKFQSSQATPPKPKGKGRGRGRARGGKGKIGLKEAQSLPADLEKKSGHHMTGANNIEKSNKSMGDSSEPMTLKGKRSSKDSSGPISLKGKRSSKDMYEQQNELWDNLNKTDGESVENTKNKKRNSKDMYEQQDELWDNLINQKDATLKANDPVTEVNDQSPDASQMIPNSCPVVMDDTFDRVAAGAVTKPSVEKESQDSRFEEDDENESCGLFQSPPDQLEGSEVVQVVNKKSTSKEKESLEEFLNRDDKVLQPLQIKKKVSWQDENIGVKSAMKVPLTLGKESKGGKLRRNKKSPGWSNVNLAIGEMNEGGKQRKYQKLNLTVAGKDAKEDNVENMDIDSVNSDPVLNERKIDKTKENPEGSLTDSVPSVISNSQASKEDLTTKRRSFPLKKVELLKTSSTYKDSVGLPSPISPMSGWSNEDIIEATMKRDGVAKLVAMEENGVAKLVAMEENGVAKLVAMEENGVAKLVAMEENGLEGQEAEVAALYSSTSTNRTSPGNAKNQTLSMECKNQENASNNSHSSQTNVTVDSHHEKSSEGRMTFQLDVETMDLEEMAKPMDTMELITQTITDSPIKCVTPTTVRRSGRQKCTPTSGSGRQKCTPTSGSGRQKCTPTPKSVLQSPSPGKTPQQVRSRRIAPMVGAGSPTGPPSSPSTRFNMGLNSQTAQSSKKLGQGNVISLSSSKKSSNASLETVLSGSTPGEKSKPFDALNPKASQSSDTVMSIGFTLSPAVEEKPAQTTMESNSPDVENISQNIDKIEKMRVRTPPKSKKAKSPAKISRSRISFKLLGKVRSDPPANPRRDRNVIFTQAGRLSERRHGPSLREIVSRAAYSSTGSVHQLAERDQSTPGGSSKVRKWLQNLETPTSLLSGPRLAVEETPTPVERVLVMETPTPAVERVLVMETPTPATKRIVMETPTPADNRLASVDSPILQDFGKNAVETPINNRVPQMASIEIQTSQSLILRENKTVVEVTGNELSVDEEKNSAKSSKETTPVTEMSAGKVNGSNTKLKRKKGKPKKDPYENPKPGTSGLSSARVTRGKASKSKVSSTRIVEVARSHLDSDSDGGAPPLVRRKSSGSSGKKSSKLSVQGIMSRIVPGDSDDMRIENIDTATSVEEDEEDKDKLKTSTISKEKENVSDVEPELPDPSQDKNNIGDDERASTPNLANALGVEEDDLASVLDIDELPDIDVVPGSHSRFMADILGESAPEVYSQDKETASQEVARLAKLQFEKDQQAAPSREAHLGSRKRSRKMSNSSDDEPISIKKRKINKIESDEEDTVVVSENSSPIKPVSKLDSLKKKIGGGGFDNSFKNLDHQMEQDQEIEAIASQPLTQTGYTAEEMDVPDVEEQETMSIVVKHDQENDKFTAPLSNMKTNSNRTVLGEVTNSPVRLTAGRTSKSKGLTKLSMAGISSLTNCNPKESESQMTRRSSSASSMATSTDSEDERTTQEIQRDVDATEMQIVKMKQQIVDGAEVLASPNLADDLKENVFESQGEEMETVGESVSLLQHEPALHEKEEVGANGGSSESQAGTTELPQREESVEVAETEDEESNKMVDSDDDLFISQTPEQSKPLRHKEKKPGAKLDTVVEIDEQDAAEQDAAPSEPSQPDTTNWKFVTTNLPAPARSLVSRWVGSLKCKGMGSKIDEEVTHVIVSTGPDMQSQRTLKYLQAVASGKLVVSHLWVERATKLGHIPPVEDFEVKDEENGGANGPWRSRVARESGKPGILNRFEVFISEELEGLSKEAVEDLLVRAGARCVPDENAFSFSPQITGVIIADSAASMEAKVVTRRLRTYNLATVEKDWLLDSLGDWTPRPLLPYMMEQVTVEDLVAAGYTGELTKPEI